ncbi:hypothetical protein, partial [Escherichia coli]|uniref:hypothetical protein n=1 Tax=Escherichia coli TaxID=562 RepID=UPI001BD35329
HALGQRFARLQEMSAINRDVLEVRQAEKEFALHGEKSDAERLRQRLAATLPSRDANWLGKAPVGR